MESEPNPQIDITLIKMMLKSIQEGDINLIKQNIQKYNLNMKLLIDTENHQNAFFYTALIKNDEDALNICKYFKELEVDPLFKDKHQQTCLYYTAREGKYLTSKYLIEECNIPINDKDIYGQHPIYYACREGHLNLCELLVEKGADVNLEDKYGQTCVQSKIMELLLNNGGIKPDNKSKKKNENKNKKSNKKSPEEEQMNKQEMIDSIQKPKKHILVKILESGEKIALNDEEIEEFKKKNPEAAKLLYNKEELEKEKKNVNEDLYLHENWEKNAKKLIGLLWKVKDADLFYKPVDPVELGLPTYFEIVKHPMDFSTIKRKLANFSYTNFNEFCKDMNLVFDNCYLFNGKDSLVGNMCTNVKSEYNKFYNQLGMDKFL